MTVSILQTLALLPSEAKGFALTFDELGEYLRKYCNTIEERQRNARHCLRDDSLYIPQNNSWQRCRRHYYIQPDCCRLSTT